MEEVNFYYLKDESGKPYGCVAFSKNEDGTVNRGISICSKEDAFKKVAARGIALKRLHDAEKQKKSFNPFMVYYGKNRTCPEGVDYHEIFCFKSAFRDTPTVKENRILYKPENF